MPTGQTLKQNRFLKPLSRYLDRHFLWQFNRRTVAGGVAVGLFFGILAPVAQILLAAIGAVMFRANLPVAAFSTLVTNPFTVPPIYYAAYRLGGFLTRPDMPATAVAELGMSKTFYERLGEAAGSFPLLLESALSIGLPLLLGLAVFAVGASVLGYFAVTGLWQLSTWLRWRRRRHRQNSML